MSERSRRRGVSAEAQREKLIRAGVFKRAAVHHLPSPAKLTRANATVTAKVLKALSPAKRTSPEKVIAAVEKAISPRRLSPPKKTTPKKRSPKKRTTHRADARKLGAHYIELYRNIPGGIIASPEKHFHRTHTRVIATHLPAKATLRHLTRRLNSDVRISADAIPLLQKIYANIVAGVTSLARRSMEHARRRRIMLGDVHNALRHYIAI